MVHALSNHSSRRLNRLVRLIELLPVVHDIDGTTLLSEHLGNLMLLLLTLLRIRPHIPNQGDLGILRRRRPALTILNRNALARLHPNDLARMKIDGGIRLTRRLRQAGRGAENMVRREIVVHLRLLDARHHPRQRRGADDRHAVFPALLELLEFRHDAFARLGLGVELGDDGAQLALDVVFEFLLGEGEVEFGGEAHHHAAEVLADELGEQLRAGVAVFDVLFGEDFVGKLGAGFEGEGFGEDEGVVAVEQDLLDLYGGMGLVCTWSKKNETD